LSSAPSAFRRYAQYYDLLYAEKDTRLECEVIVEAIRRHSSQPISTLLDIGCGTGRHILQFGGTGWQLTGADISEEMLDIARSRANAAGIPVEFAKQDMRTLDLGRHFDVVTCLFAAFSYMTTNQDVQSALTAMRKHLLPGGLLVMDFWHGPAVLALRPEVREMRAVRDGVEVVRTATPCLDTMAHTCSIRYDLVAKRGEDVVDEVREDHVMRFFFPKEFEYFLSTAGFDVVAVSAFPSLERVPTESDWEALLVASARTEPSSSL